MSLHDDPRHPGPHLLTDDEFIPLDDQEPDHEPDLEGSDEVEPAPEGAATSPHAGRILGLPPRFIILGLLLTILALVVGLILDAQPPARPRVELIDQGGLPAVAGAQRVPLRDEALRLAYPVSLVFAGRPESRGAWERELAQLARPDRLVIGIAVETGWVVLERGQELHLGASEEHAIRAAAENQVRAGEPGRGAMFALAQARRFSPTAVAPVTRPALDPSLLRLGASLLMPIVGLGFFLVVAYRRIGTRPAEPRFE